MEGQPATPEDSTNKLIVNYLPSSLSKNEMRKLFASVGPLTTCDLVRDKSTKRSLCYGFVKYANPDDTKKAVRTFNGLAIRGKILKVSYARPSDKHSAGADVYVCGLPFTTTPEQLTSLFAPFGSVGEARFSQHGNGFVRFDRREEAETAVRYLHNTVPPGASRPVRVTIGHKETRPILYRPACWFPAFGWSIFVYNLPRDIQDVTLWQLFGPLGTVHCVRVVRDSKTQRCKGFGFVTMKNYEEAWAAVRSLNGCVLGDHILYVSFKSDKITAEAIQFHPYRSG